MSAKIILPNLGAEEGSDWQVFQTQAQARIAARLWSHLYSGQSNLRYRRAASDEAWKDERCGDIWPATLGDIPSKPVFDWLERSSAPTAWLNTKALQQSIQLQMNTDLSGASPEITFAVHDKAFAQTATRELSILHKSLVTLIRIIEPEALRSPDSLIAELNGALLDWPEWTGRRFTLKPRHGTSGRGRVAGVETLDTAAVRGGLARLAERGGALFEPWLQRTVDLSVTMHIPAPSPPPGPPGAVALADPAAPIPSSPESTTILGSLEMLASQAGLYRGHFGEVDSRGRIFSGHAQDESLRADAAAIANQARGIGFFGACGVDSFGFRQPNARDEDTPEQMRSGVEFNARATMGLVTIGLVRRALARVRTAMSLEPGQRHGFAFSLNPNQPHEIEKRLRSACGSDVVVIDLGSTTTNDDPRPVLIFSRDATRLRHALLQVLGC